MYAKRYDARLNLPNWGSSVMVSITEHARGITMHAAPGGGRQLQNATQLISSRELRNEWTCLELLLICIAHR
jgi:hypothetical protein